MTHLKRNSLLVATTALLALFSCQRSENRFRIEGDLQHVTGSEFYLFGTQKPFDRIDTIRLENGKFSYETELDTLVPLTILFGDGTKLPLFADKNLTVSIEGDAALPDSIRIRGGEANEELSQFKRQLRALKDSAAQVAEADSFIRRHPFSQVSVYLLDRYFVQTPRPDYDRIGKLIESMSGMLHDSPLIQSVQKNAEQWAKTDTGRYVSSFRMRNLKGNYLTSYNFKEKVVVLSFWATWSKPSLALQDSLKTLQKRHKKEDVAFIHFSIDTDRKRWEEAAEKDTLSGEQAFDGSGWESNVVKQFGISRIPTVVLLSPQRKIVAKFNSADGLEERLKALLKEEKEKRAKQKRR